MSSLETVYQQRKEVLKAEGLAKKFRYEQIHLQTTCDFCLWYFWKLKHSKLDVSTCASLRDRRATCAVAEVLVSTCAYLRDRRATCAVAEVLVSTCAYLRDRRATCAQLDYLCLTCAYLSYLCLHVHSCCIESLPVHTFCTCGMITLSNINLLVFQKWFHYLGMHSFLQKICSNVQK